MSELSIAPAPGTAGLQLPKSSKENSWYCKDIGGKLSPSSRKLLEEYSRISSKDVEAHVLRIRDTLWSSAPYPCVGSFKFLTLNLPNHPFYPHLLPLLQPAPAPASGPFLLDLGCCVGQELRFLTSVGIPSENLSGSDLVPSFLNKSYELFNDKDKFKGKLVQANIFSDTLFDDAFEGWQGRFRVVHAGLFLHLFSREQQLVVCEKVVKLLSDEKGSIFLGEQVGCLGGGLRGVSSGTKTCFLHDAKTFAGMWDEVAQSTGTEARWAVKAEFKVRDKASSVFVGEGIGWLTFSVERV